jgi:hypothetical protein
MYLLQEEIQEIRIITNILNYHHKVNRVLLIKEDRKAALNRELG